MSDTITTLKAHMCDVLIFIRQKEGELQQAIAKANELNKAIADEIEKTQDKPLPNPAA